MNLRGIKNTLAVALSVMAFSGATTPAAGEVVFDGTVGPGGTLSGDFDIPDNFGTQVGNGRIAHHNRRLAGQFDPGC